MHRAVVVFLIVISLAGQPPREGAAPVLENTGKPMLLPFECTEADTQAAGLSCSEDEPCAVFMELSNVDAVGNKIFITGNLHSQTVTLHSILLGTEDAGQTWSEPHPRIRFGGLDQIQFVDFQNGWISGATLQPTPRDPFLLLTTDGGKTWRRRPIYDDTRVAVIERFWFESRENGTMLIDSRLDKNRHELYETMTGGESWSLRQASVDPIRFPRTREPGTSGWRLQPDAATHSYNLEKMQADQWQKVASFLVNVGSCKQ